MGPQNTKRLFYSLAKIYLCFDSLLQGGVLLLEDFLGWMSAETRTLKPTFFMPLSILDRLVGVEEELTRVGQMMQVCIKTLRKRMQLDV